MKYRMEMKIGHGAGDSVCFLSACRAFARRTDSVAYVSECRDVVEAYRDDRLRFGTEGMMFSVTCPEAAHRLKEPGEYGNYYGTYLAAVGIHPGGLPRLELPEFPDGPSYDLIQPCSVWAANPPVEYVQSLADEFARATGRELFVVGRRDTPRLLRNVRYDLLCDGIPELMALVRSARLVMSPRSLTAHLAAGYGRPSLVWAPDDGENWHLDYPGWPRELEVFDRRPRRARDVVAAALDRAGEAPSRRPAPTRAKTSGRDEELPDPLENLERFRLPSMAPVRLPMVSVVVETRPEMMGRVRSISEWHRRWFSFHREIVVSDRDPGIPGTTFVNCGRPPPPEPKDGLLNWYSDMCVRWLAPLCDAPFMLVWQWDGFVTNPFALYPGFTEWDYVGAPMETCELFAKMEFLRRNVSGWEAPGGPCVVGNGGFSLRSRRFLEASAALPGKGLSSGTEDFYLCVERRREMEAAGVRFAPVDVAYRFSRESDVAEHDECFGFHGHWFLGDVKKMLEARYLVGG